VTIEQAKGMLAERLHVSVDEAFNLLRRHARSHNLRLSDLPRDVAQGSATALELVSGT
jgi:AmiR/NasT family two-component response regulator